jgi:ATP-dependent RNA helicase HrpB
MALIHVVTDTPPKLPKLPISEVLSQIQQTLRQQHELVVEAPPGAGKTTLVPLALLNEPWLAKQRILVLEPRRMAARSAAQRMASLLGEPIGHTVGYRVRQDNQVGPHTRIEVITEGILTRMLLHDPSLEGIGLIIFDEFHERSIDADFGLALALQGRELFREQHNALRLLVMSATLDGEGIAQLLNNATIIRSAGKAFPVDIVYGKTKRYDEDITDIVANTLVDVISRHTDGVLVFLPGQGEIHLVMQKLNDRLPLQDKQNTQILPLYGALPLEEQLRAIGPIATLKQPSSQIQPRKIVLATDIAETSLTIEGITVVVDAGLCREPCFDPATGMTRLQTRRISKDSSIQRAGRAGRLEPGSCYRLWSEEQQTQLAQYSTPQILQTDLAPLALQLLAWGIDDITELKWLDLPPLGPLSQALDLLANLGAISQQSGQQNKDPTEPSARSHTSILKGWRIGAHGELMTRFPIHPRLSHMLLRGAQHQQLKLASMLAALLSERSPLNREFGADLSQQIAVVMGDIACNSRYRSWLNRTKQQAKVLRRMCEQRAASNTNETKNQWLSDESALGFLLSCAYPERIARQYPGSNNRYLLANGRCATLNEKDPLCNQPWLVAAELGGHHGKHNQNANDRIFSATAFDPALLNDQCAELTEENETLFWDEQSDRLLAEHIRSIGKIVFSRKRIETIDPNAKCRALIAMINKRGLSLLPWNSSTRQWQARVMLLNSVFEKPGTQVILQAQPKWPDVSDQNLLLTISQWLSPFLHDITMLSDFQKLDLQTILNALLPWPLPQQLDELAPTTLKVPSGSRVSIDYTSNPPILNVKLQEMFGCQTTPTIANGRVKLMLHLLSPARRPLQVTQDLTSFWSSSYIEVKKEMKGRYPKHPWPDNPLQALPTRKTKRHLKPD